MHGDYLNTPRSESYTVEAKVSVLMRDLNAPCLRLNAFVQHLKTLGHDSTTREASRTSLEVMCRRECET